MVILKEAVEAAVKDENFRETLGNEVSLHVQKMIMASIFEIGTGGQAFLYHSGYMLGKQLVDAGICGGDTLREALESIVKVVDQFKLGILTIDKVSEDSAVISNHECHFCSGFPVTGETVCFYESGLVSGILDSTLKGSYETTEVKCISTGHNACEYQIKKKS